MLAAIADAKRWQGGDVLLRLAPVADSALTALSGRSGVMRVVLVRYGGFEPVERLVAAAIVGGDAVAPEVAAKLIRLEAADCADIEAASDPDLMADALDEALFTDQREIENAEQKRFEKAIGQLERFVEDKVLVSRRERSALGERLRAARERRDNVVGASDRERVESEIQALASREEILEARIAALESREDEVYRRWRDRYHELRYEPPAIKPLFEARFRISAPIPETSC